MERSGWAKATGPSGRGDRTGVLETPGTLWCWLDYTSQRASRASRGTRHPTRMTCNGHQDRRRGMDLSLHIAAHRDVFVSISRRIAPGRRSRRRIHRRLRTIDLARSSTMALEMDNRLSRPRWAGRALSLERAGLERPSPKTQQPRELANARPDVRPLYQAPRPPPNRRAGTP